MVSHTWVPFWTLNTEKLGANQKEWQGAHTFLLRAAERAALLSTSTSWGWERAVSSQLVAYNLVWLY